jgi:hypothetical protein
MNSISRTQNFNKTKISLELFYLGNLFYISRTNVPENGHMPPAPKTLPRRLIKAKKKENSKRVTHGRYRMGSKRIPMKLAKMPFIGILRIPIGILRIPM